ncbi:AAA family ATPase [Rhodocaloribacter litoris]|uniref:DEAD/DEAH box helicase n=1 Tax=Rhodocaloribacter litoris TaxID=2558931 RepID=UPI0014243EBE|nr:AAA domain-containing protein [Rhodocaloribacter litoris]QXD15800.1 AAA family ATPase [Rhodocaloribacter litoris]
MPSLKKKAISLYLRTGCQRQLLLNLYGDKERRELAMPPRQTVRAGLGLVGKAGYDWQDEKVSELGTVFGAEHVHMNPKREGNRPGTLDLRDVLSRLTSYQFVVEGRFDPNTDTFRRAIGLNELRDLQGEPLGVGNAFPDVVQVLPPMRERAAWEQEIKELGPGASGLEVLPGGDVHPLDEHDGRLRLRVIDIKQTAEPGAHYFAEVVYYSMALAAWLVEYGHTDRFVVVATPAVWPGSYEASALMEVRERCRKAGREPTAEELALALEDDLEIAPFDVFAPRLRRFFREELPYVLQTPWDELPWHVSYACAGCDFLGYPWKDASGKLLNDPLHCWPTAEEKDHLSRVAGLSRGGARLLRPVAANVAALAGVEADDVAFNASPTLRAKRTVYPHRARSLQTETAGVIPDSGSDALMPRWPDLHVYVFLDYDLASAVTAAFSLRAFWKEPLPFGSVLETKRRRWAAVDNKMPTGFQEVFLVDRRDLDREREELVKFLCTLRGILDEVRHLDDADVEAGRRGDPDEPEKAKRSTYQIYLWDEAQRKHLVRVVGRHLGAVLSDTRLRDLAWLFPPPELLVHAEDASHKSPFTLVSDVVQNTVAVPVPHHYTLLDVVQAYRPDPVAAPSVHPLYREPLSDLIPGERLHEMWTHRGDWLNTANTIRETTGKKLSALAYVVSQLERDLGSYLTRAAAPPVIRPPRRLTGVPPHSELWHEYTRLNKSLEELDTLATRAMPPHEREARFKSAHLVRRLEGAEKAEALRHLAAASQHALPPADDLAVYTLSPDSREFNVRPPALGYALSPRSQPAFLQGAAYPLVKDHDIHVPARLSGSVAEVGLTQVSVEAIDRVRGLIALKQWYTNVVPEMEAAGVVDLSADVMLDPVSTDFLTKKVRATLLGIGRPPSAQHDEATLRALGIDAPDTTPTSPESPASEFLWQAPVLAETEVDVDVAAARAALEASGVRLNDSQWAAWEAALTRRLALIWGPPGTGKSQTLRAVVAGAVWLAHRAGKPLRLLIAAGTYAAVDNVLLGADRLLAALLPEKPYRLVRIQSSYSELPVEQAEAHPDVETLTVKTTRAPEEVLTLQGLLEHPEEIVVVAGPSQQLHNLALATKNKSKPRVSARPALTQRRWFDLVLIDEASQLDVAESTLVVSKAADEAAFVLAGDDKQLPPIHQATPPQDLDHLVGSVYGYVRHHHGVAPCPLQVNYRSCQTLVAFTKQAGYDPRLHAHHRDLRLALLTSRFPEERPEDWPAMLHWTPGWAALLAPSKPAACFIYEDEVASQANAFEADAVAALLRLFYGRVDRQLAGELDEDGREKPLTGRPHDPEGFWNRAVGVVTPHRAQMGKIVARLQAAFPDHDPGLIWGAVDTVERFQGQQRDVIVASFGLGDPDLIRAEDEFLYSLNRFNVMASRARAKLIVFTTRSLVDHLSNDADVLEESRLLKNFAESFCKDPQLLTLGYLDEGRLVERAGVLRTR